MVREAIQGRTFIEMLLEGHDLDDMATAKVAQITRHILKAPEAAMQSNYDAMKSRSYVRVSS